MERKSLFQDIDLQRLPLGLNTTQKRLLYWGKSGHVVQGSPTLLRGDISSSFHQGLKVTEWGGATASVRGSWVEVVTPRNA